MGVSDSSPHSSQQLLAYAQATYSWEAGQKTEDELLQRIWNLADDVGRLVEQLETAEFEKERLRSLLADVWADYAHQLDEPLLSLIDDAVDVYRQRASNPAKRPS